MAGRILMTLLVFAFGFSDCRPSEENNCNHFPEPGMPGMFGMPGMPGMYGPPGMSGMPGMFGPPGMSAMPGVFGPPGMSAMPGVFGPSGMPGIPGAFGPPGMPGMPEISGMPGPSGMSKKSKKSKKSRKTKISGMDGMAGMAGLAGMTEMLAGLSGMAGGGGLNGFPSEMGEEQLISVVMSLLEQLKYNQAHQNPPNFEIPPANPSLHNTHHHPQPDNNEALFSDIETFCRENPELCAEMNLEDLQLEHQNDHACSECEQHPCQCQESLDIHPAEVEGCRFDLLQPSGETCSKCEQHPCQCQASSDIHPEEVEGCQLDLLEPSGETCSKCEQHPCQCQEEKSNIEDVDDSQTCSEGERYPCQCQEVDCHTQCKDIKDQCMCSLEWNALVKDLESAEGVTYSCEKESEEPSFWTWLAKIQQKSSSRAPGNGPHPCFKDNPTVVSQAFMKAMLKWYKSNVLPDYIAKKRQARRRFHSESNRERFAPCLAQGMHGDKPWIYEGYVQK